jgi:signal transduction histidine kinase
MARKGLFFSRLTLKTKLVVLVAGPFLVLLYFSLDKIRREQEQIRHLETVYDQEIQIEHISRLIHELQKERDFAINYLLNPLYISQVQFENQITQTDSIFEDYKKYMLEEHGDTNSFELFSQLPKTRAEITWSYQDHSDVEQYFNGLIQQLTGVVVRVSREAKIPKTRDEMVAYSALFQTKEYLGRIRNKVNEAFIYGRFQGLGYGQFSGYKGAFESSLNEFLKYAPPELKTKFEMEFSGGTIINTLEMIDYCFENKDDRLVNYTAENWWLSVTGAINSLHELELSISASIKGTLEEEKQRLNKEVQELYLTLGGVLTSLLLLVLLISNSITQRLGHIRSVASEIAEGKTSKRLDEKSDDAIGMLSKKFNELAANADEIAKIAHKIGEGNYDVQIELRSDEDALGKALTSMRDELSASQQALNSKIQELRDAYRYKSAFLANMSHELRTPLNSLLILAELLSNNKEGNLNQEQIDSAKTIVRSGRNLLHLINDILDLSKIEAGRMTVNLEDIELREIVEDINDVFIPFSKKKNVRYKFECENNVPKTIVTDKNRLEQVLKNLISNAIKFTPEEGEVVCSVFEEDGQLQFKVTDTGIGISKDQQKKVFEAFHQADGATNRKYEGTGLGLSITKNLVEMLGGRMVLNSEEGKGTEVFFNIPLSATERKSNLGENQETDQEIEHQDLKPEIESIELNFVQIPEKVKQYLKNKRVILFDVDINHVFELSGSLSEVNAEVLDASDIEELKSKLEQEEVHFVINNSNLSLAEITKVKIVNLDNASMAESDSDKAWEAAFKAIS